MVGAARSLARAREAPSAPTGAPIAPRRVGGVAARPVTPHGRRRVVPTVVQTIFRDRTRRSDAQINNSCRSASWLYPWLGSRLRSLTLSAREYGTRSRRRAQRTVSATGFRILPRTGPVGSIANWSFNSKRSRYRHKSAYIQKCTRNRVCGLCHVRPSKNGSTLGYRWCCARRASATRSSSG